MDGWMDGWMEWMDIPMTGGYSSNSLLAKGIGNLFEIRTDIS
jgi:hypothetical protein